ncbi:hypothetical protein B0H17DRAFT_542003 [Mycena rosella]|uniref:Uncharacterized protein n=1 Tax=Mycena rosella TaxID=1033263 RepID=A0AAD7BSX8_MYCRO|nr:hypothetical protein B0H17DRAFT_542003 [Mycena rosella]
MPRYLVDYEPGDEWDGAEKSYASFNIAYESQKAQLDIEPSHSDLQVKTGMGINLRPSGLEQILPKISFINRNQVLIWVLDPTSKSRVRGIVVLMSSYLDNIRAKERLSIYEQEDIDLINTATLKKREATNEEHKPGTISVSIVNVQAPKARRLAIIPAFRARRQPLVTPVDIPPHEILARGWNATNNEWRTVLWPALDQNMQAAEAEGTSAAWKIKWDVTPNTPEAEESQKTDRKGTGIGEGNGKGKGKGKGPV